MKKDNESINYDFELESVSDFKMVTDMSAKNRLLTFIFQKAKFKLMREQGMHIKGNINELKEFDVPIKYYKLVGSILGKKTNEIIKEVVKDYREKEKRNLEIIRVYVDSCSFKRDKNNDWLVKVNFKGQYVIK